MACRSGWRAKGGAAWRSSRSAIASKPAQAVKDLYAIGEIPPLGHVPEKMHAWAIRKERHGPPETSMQLEVVPTWPIGEDEVLVYVMAAGVNYNGVWAGLGIPISPLDGHKNPFHVAGSDAAGVVWAIGSKVRRWKVGDEVIVHCNQDDGDDEDCNGGDPLLSPSQRIWGYETPDGSFAQFCRVQSRQLMQKPAHLPWEEAACYTLTLATAYRMLFGHAPHIAQARRLRAGVGRLGRPRRVRRAACRRVRRQGDRRHLRQFEARLRDGPRRLRRHQPQGLQVLGPDAHGEHARVQRLGEGGAQVRQGDLGHHRQARRRHRVRASRRGRPSRCRAWW